MTKPLDGWRQTVWDYYDNNGRHDLPWRQPMANGQFDPYAITVSEIMLQQTQVGRVMPKFQQFLSKFPTVQALAQAELADVIIAWSGLGYNRRAKFLWQTARNVVSEHHGVFPQTIPELVHLPGIGTNTAGAIAAYAFNRPVIFVETNVRTVLIHHLFADETNIKDQLLLPHLQDAADAVVDEPDRSIREWYWALMDYGSYLKQTVGNLNQQSAHYAKQSAFEGSKRQLRGTVLRALASGALTSAQLAKHIQDNRLQVVLEDLTREVIITYKDGQYHLGSA